MIIYNQLPIYNKQGVLVAFDVFIKNDCVFLIMPLYHNYPHYSEFNIQIKNAIIRFQEDIIKDVYEAHRILIYKIISNNNTNNEVILSIKYQNVIYSCKRLINNPIHEDVFLGQTTLCQNDYMLLNVFTNHYTEQGVERFYIYYNGKLTKEILNYVSNLKNTNNIILIQWDFPYWHDNTRHSKHHAQLAQIHHAIYFFGKKHVNFMIFCDLDEYFYISKDVSLFNFVKQRPGICTFTFLNVWAQPLHTRDNGTNNERLPNKFLKSSHKHDYKWRSKCIHNINYIKTINIHHHYAYNIKNPLIYNNNNTMFHFFNWTQKNRTIDSIEKGVQFEMVEL